MEIGISVVLVLFFIVIGTKVNVSFLAGSFIYLLLSGTSFDSVASTAFFQLEKTSILAIPLFMLAGDIMERAGLADKLIDFADAILKPFKGALGATIPLASMFFGAINGSGTATISSLSKIFVPKMSRMGWDKRYTATMLACSASLGYMIPPNMNAILFSSVADVSVAAIFMATLVPGIMWGALLMIVNRVVYSKWYNPEKAIKADSATSEEALTSEDTKGNKEPKDYLSNLSSSFVKSIPAIIMMVIIFVGIYGGYFSPTEAGAVSGIYAIIVGFLSKKLNGKGLLSSFKECGQSMGSFMIILPMVGIFSRYLILNQVPQSIAAGISQITTNPIVIMLLMDLILVIAGMFLDAGVLILVITPMLIPTAQMIGMNTIQLAVVMFVCVGIGTVTPPMAMNLFIGAKSADIEVADMIKPLGPLLVFGCIPILFLVTFVPEISLWLPRVLGFSV